MAGPDHHRVHIRDDMGPLPSQLPVHLLLLLVQFLSGVYYVITSVALVGGMNRIVLSLYRDIVAMIVLVPVAYFVDKGNRVVLSWDVIFHLVVLGFFGIFGSNFLLFVGIEYTSPELSSAVQPFIPVATAVIAIVFGSEVIHWNRRDGQSKVVAIVASCTGATLMTFYKGPAILTLWNNVGQGWTPLWASLNDMNFTGMGTLHFAGWGITKWQFGGLMLIGQCLCMASFINLQALLLKRYPAPVSVLAYSYGFGAICMAATGFFVVPDLNEWKLGWDANLLVVLYNGLIASALNFGIMGWCLTRVGPLFVSSYIPLQTVITAVMSLVFLGSTIYLGSIIGAVLVLVGLLLISWAREESVHLASLSRSIQGNDPEQLAPIDARLKEPMIDALQEPLLQVGHS